MTERMLADTLCRDHLSVLPGGGAIGTEIALLAQLSAAVGSSNGHGSAPGGGSVSGRSLIDMSALDLHSTISRRVTRELHELGVGATRGTLAHRAGVWLYALPPGTYAGVERDLAAWEQAIRRLLDPPRQVPLRGVHCGGCGYAQVLLPDSLEPGRDLQAPALLVTLEAGPHAQCRVCGAEYDTDGLRSLGG